MSNPDPDYPLSSFTNATWSVVFRVVAFFLTCVAAITLGQGIHGDWVNPFDTVLVPYVVIVNIFTGVDLVLGVTLFLFVYRQGSWHYLLVGFLVQTLGAWIAAAAK